MPELSRTATTIIEQPKALQVRPPGPQKLLWQAEQRDATCRSCRSKFTRLHRYKVAELWRLTGLAWWNCKQIQEIQMYSHS